TTVHTIRLGRITYAMFAGYWPNAGGDEKAFADKMAATPRIVFSRTVDEAPWGTWDGCRVVRGAAPDEVMRLKRHAGKDLVMWGSLSVAQSLTQAGLIDEYHLVVCPVVLGGGRPLFREDMSLNMQLLNATTLDRGAVYLRYARQAPLSEDSSKEAEVHATAAT